MKFSARKRTSRKRMHKRKSSGLMELLFGRKRRTHRKSKRSHKRMSFGKRRRTHRKSKRSHKRMSFGKRHRKSRRMSKRQLKGKMMMDMMFGKPTTRFHQKRYLAHLADLNRFNNQKGPKISKSLWNDL